MIKSLLETEIAKALTALNFEVPKITLEHPGELAHGDYATNVAMVLAKQFGKNPRELAQQIVTELAKNTHEYIEKIEIAGPGFINFRLANQFFADAVREVLAQGDTFGILSIGRGKKVLVEYSSPNIAKPFGIGHLRSTIIGDAVANLMQFSGFTVIRDNHVGDWGTQFGKLIVALKKWGNIEEAKQSAEPIKYLVGLYVKFHDEAQHDPTLEDEARGWFVKLEAGDPEVRSLWKTCVHLSLSEFNRIYDRLGVTFDTELGESFFEDKMEAVIAELQAKELLSESEGAKLVFFPDEKYSPLMIVKSDGSTLYGTRDLAADKYRLETYGSDVTIVNEVGAEQTLYFRQLFETEKMLGWFREGQRIHVAHGLIIAKGGGKLSTRKGDAIWLEAVLDEAVKRAAEFNTDPVIAEAVGIGAIKYNDLKRESIKDITFDWDEILNLKGNSGPYLQYVFARIQSILEKAGEQVEFTTTTAPTTAEKLLYRFPEIVERASLEYAPHHICTYLFELASAFNAFYGETKIIDDTPESPYKVALSKAVGQVLKNGLNLLGIKAPEKM